jgi:hypothetical protein
MKDDPMTDTTYTVRPQDGLARLFWLWLTTPRPSTCVADLDTLSDHMRRDIGRPRDPLDQMSIRTLDDAMRYSG